ncbi:MAG: pantetheine-phosphate adenylyltransferase [Paludibacteraceae bacterium]|nr:pantetheine-phosphate adenylyltransferase [Paludibacteraceae bacterium]
MERIALFSGSFNPFTIGHENIVNRSLAMFDKVIIGIGINSEKSNDNAKKNLAEIENKYKNEPRVKVITYNTLTADVVKKENATCIIRGIRNDVDLKYESEIAQVNYTLFNVETIFLLASPELKEISSSLVRELQKFGKNITDLLP